MSGPTPIAGTNTTSFSAAANVIDYRVWFADRSAVMVSAASEGEARMQAETIARRNGHAPHELAGRVASIEVLP